MGGKNRGPATSGPTTASTGVGMLGELLLARGLTKGEAAPVEAPSPAAAPPPATEAEPLRGRFSLAMERAGRGGKTVTLVSWADRGPRERDDLAARLRKALGTGATVEGERVVVQGDQRERIRTWLTARGVTDIRG